MATEYPTFVEMRISARMTVSECCKYLKKSPSTIKQYDRKNAPYAVLVAMSWKSGHAKGFEQIKFCGKEAINDLGEKIPANAMRSFGWYSKLMRQTGYSVGIGKRSGKANGLKPASIHKLRISPHNRQEENPAVNNM